MLDVRLHLPGSCGDMSLPTCGSGYFAALYTFVPLRCLGQKNSPTIVAISVMPPRTAPTITAIGTESPPDCECSGIAVVAISVEELARLDVEVIETGTEEVVGAGTEEDVMVVKEAGKDGVGVEEPVSTDVPLDELGPDADRSQMVKRELPILLTFARCPILIGRTFYPRIACFNHTTSYEALVAAVEDTPVRAASITLQNVRAHCDRWLTALESIRAGTTLKLTSPAKGS